MTTEPLLLLFKEEQQNETRNLRKPQVRHENRTMPTITLSLQSETVVPVLMQTPTRKENRTGKTAGLNPDSYGTQNTPTSV